MPRIFDNIQEHLQHALLSTLHQAERADFCVGYFNLRGWRLLCDAVDALPAATVLPDGQAPVRLLIGMHRSPQEEVRSQFSLLTRPDQSLVDAAQKKLAIRSIARDLRDQLMTGIPTNRDEEALRALARQLRESRVRVRLYPRAGLHAKLYLMHQPRNYSAPVHAYLGSSNLTFAGLYGQGELNTEVTDVDSARKLEAWFEDRWAESLDVTDALITVLDDSWAREKLLTPYEVYLKIAYHLAQEAIAGLSGEFKLPNDMAELLFDYQAKAVQIAAHHLNKRGGVLLGDVVGLGKTLMATALARIFHEDYGYDTLIICPKNLVRMWENIKDTYDIGGKVIPFSLATRQLGELRRYQLVIIDESHNLRSGDGQRYAAIQEYITRNDSRCVLLSATPYNKSFLDLSAQLRLFIPEDRDLGVRPERYINEIGEVEFNARHQTTTRSLAAFEKSEYADDWRDLMRLYLVRRTRSFIIRNYAHQDSTTGRSFLLMRDGTRSFFPVRAPKTATFPADEQYTRLYSEDVVNRISALHLPRYGLGQYQRDNALKIATDVEKQQLENLSRAGKRLMGFCRTNLFKRLESSGASFLQSLDRHILRNAVYLYAIENDLELPIGTLDGDTVDPNAEDEDSDSLLTAEDVGDLGGEPSPELVSLEDGSGVEQAAAQGRTRSITAAYTRRAEAAYKQYAGSYRRRFKWLRPALFTRELAKALRDDMDSLLSILAGAGAWDAARDTKLIALHTLLTQTHSGEKVLVFSQFADTVRYLHDHLRDAGVARMAAATGSSDDPTALAWRFSPMSNKQRMNAADELRVLLATDVLSEGQNLQDAAIVINYDLPWAIIRLSQRAGRVDRIGQQAERILCYSFLPADGVEALIRLRARVRQRLAENGEVVGSDEQFFEDDQLATQLRDLYTEKSGILDDELETDVDLASYAYQIWANALKDNPIIAKRVAELPDVVYATRHYEGSYGNPQGVLTYMKTADGNDALAWLDAEGNPVTQSQYRILKMAECDPNTPPAPRHPQHHDLVAQAVTQMQARQAAPGGQLGCPHSVRCKAYHRLKHYVERVRATMPMFANTLITADLEAAIDQLYQHPLRATAREAISRQMRAGVSDEDLVTLIVGLRVDDRLSLVQETDNGGEPRIVCSMGLFDL